MGLGNNRDYKTRDRAARRAFAILKERAAELEAQGVENPMSAAGHEMEQGLLNKRLKTWVDPIVKHNRERKYLNSLPEGVCYVVYWQGEYGWEWAVGGFDDGVLRSVDCSWYKSRKALFASLDESDTYKSFQRIRKP